MCESVKTEQQKIIQHIIKEEVKDVEAELKKHFEFRKALLINQTEKRETRIFMNQKSILETLDFVRNPPTSFYSGSKQGVSLLESTVTYDEQLYSK